VYVSLIADGNILGQITIPVESTISQLLEKIEKVSTHQPLLILTGIGKEADFIKK
jgi:hypothetical protein